MNDPSPVLDPTKFSAPAQDFVVGFASSPSFFVFVLFVVRFRPRSLSRFRSRVPSLSPLPSVSLRGRLRALFFRSLTLSRYLSLSPHFIYV